MVPRIRTCQSQHFQALGVLAFPLLHVLRPLRHVSTDRSVLGLVPAIAPPGTAQRFWLARHGQTTFNAEKRFQGSLSEEPVLTDKGVRQARDLGLWLQSLGDAAAQLPIVSTVFSSPLRRAQQTLVEARTSLREGVLPDAHATVTLQELREIDLYEWQGRTQAEIAAADPGALRLWKERTWELRLGGGRAVVGDLWERAAVAWGLMRAAAAPAARGGPSLIIAHGTLGKALLSVAVGLPVQAFRFFKLGNGEVVEVAWPQDVAIGPNGGAFWRRRYPEEGPWRSSEEEQAHFAGAGGTTEVGAVDAA